MGWSKRCTAGWGVVVWDFSPRPDGHQGWRSYNCLELSLLGWITAVNCNVKSTLTSQKAKKCPSVLKFGEVYPSGSSISSLMMVGCTSLMMVAVLTQRNPHILLFSWPTSHIVCASLKIYAAGESGRASGTSKARKLFRNIRNSTTKQWIVIRFNDPRLAKSHYLKT